MSFVYTPSLLPQNEEERVPARAYFRATGRLLRRLLLLRRHSSDDRRRRRRPLPPRHARTSAPSPVPRGRFVRELLPKWTSISQRLPLTTRNDPSAQRFFDEIPKIGSGPCPPHRVGTRKCVVVSHTCCPFTFRRHSMPVEHTTKSGVRYYVSTTEELAAEAVEEAAKFAAEVDSWRRGGGKVIIERTVEAQAQLDQRRTADAATAAAATAAAAQASKGE